MNEKPTVSIVIPVYNVAPYLRECLDSIRAQTLTDWECICVDDGSTDDSLVILNEYAAMDARFHVIRCEHSNAGSARNAGFDIARGQFLSFLDSDDVFSSRMMEILTSAAIQTNADVATCGQLDFQEGEPLPSLDDRHRRRRVDVFRNPAENIDIYSSWRGQAWDKLFRKEFIDLLGIRFQEIRSTNDLRFTYSALCRAKVIVRTNRCLVAHRINAGSLVSTYDRSPLCMFEALAGHRADMLACRTFSKYPGLERRYSRWAAKLLLAYMEKMKTVDGYCKVHDEFVRRFSDLGFQTITDMDFRQDPDAFARLEGIRNGCTALETSRQHELWLRKRVLEVGGLHIGKRELVERKVGKFVTWLPYQVFSFIKGLFQHVSARNESRNGDHSCSV